MQNTLEEVNEMSQIFEFEEIISDIISNKTVQKMNEFKHHYSISCFEHSKSVAYYSYLMAKKLNLDYVSAARAGMLHDLFLYDWRKPGPDHKRFHGYRHPRIALNNSLKLFDLNEVEKDCIIKHMWPLTVVPPKYKESFIVSIADKYSTYLENKKTVKNNSKFQKLYRYSSVFLSLLIFRIV
jgi:uncharacterized protein